MSNRQEELACDFSAIPEDEREDHQRVAESVFESIKNVEELPGGYTFQLPANSDVIERVGAFMARERLCCPFFNFELEVESDGGPVLLRLTGSDRVKTFIEDTVLTEWDL